METQLDALPTVFRVLEQADLGHLRIEVPAPQTYSAKICQCSRYGSDRNSFVPRQIPGCILCYSSSFHKQYKCISFNSKLLLTIVVFLNLHLLHLVQRVLLLCEPFCETFGQTSENQPTKMNSAIFLPSLSLCLPQTLQYLRL